MAESQKTSRTIESYNRNAKKFEAKFLNFAPYQEKLALFQEKYLGLTNATILDVGCGPGNHSRYLYRLNSKYQITGIDLSEEMINRARKNAPDCRFIKGDIRDLNLDQTFDAVIASFCIVHLSNSEVEKLIAQINTLLNPHGQLYLSFIEGDETGFMKPAFFDEQIYFNFFQRLAVFRLLAENRFNVNNFYEYDYLEEDGTTLKEIFIFAQKTAP